MENETQSVEQALAAFEERLKRLPREVADELLVEAVKISVPEIVASFDDLQPRLEEALLNIIQKWGPIMSTENKTDVKLAGAVEKFRQSCEDAGFDVALANSQLQELSKAQRRRDATIAVAAGSAGIVIGAAAGYVAGRRAGAATSEGGNVLPFASTGE